MQLHWIPLVCSRWEVICKEPFVGKGTVHTKNSLTYIIKHIHNIIKYPITIENAGCSLMAPNNNQIWHLSSIDNDRALNFIPYWSLSSRSEIEYLWKFIIVRGFFVVVPPHQMLLYDKSGADVSGVVGPLEEGSALVLVCEVRGGKSKW